MHATGISAEEKRAALAQLLSSVTFRRAEQLRQFLQFVVEEEIAGRGTQIREWDIAVRALNRPPSYTPETDSTVRTRAHALRQRLAEYYRIEAPDAELRIDLPKGGYTPVFHRVLEAPPPPPVVDPQEPAEASPPPAETAARLFWSPAWRPAVIALLGGLLLGASAMVLLMRPSRATLPVEVTEAWAPMFHSPTPVKVILSSPFQLWVRDYRGAPPPLVDPVESPPMQENPTLLGAYKEVRPLFADSRLYLHTNAAGALWGDAAGVQVATRFLAEQGARPELVPERSLKSGYVLRNDSYLVFGRSEYSPLMDARIPKNGFDVQYMPSIRRHGIALRDNPDRGPKFLPTAGPQGTNYGLITILRDRADDGHTCQAMFFSGVISNGAQAAIEYMTTPRHLQELRERLRKQGITSWPKAMQIVVRTDTSEFYPIRTEFQAHLVLER